MSGEEWFLCINAQDLSALAGICIWGGNSSRGFSSCFEQGPWNFQQSAAYFSTGCRDLSQLLESAGCCTVTFSVMTSLKTAAAILLYRCLVLIRKHFLYANKTADLTKWTLISELLGQCSSCSQKYCALLFQWKIQAHYELHLGYISPPPALCTYKGV